MTGPGQGHPQGSIGSKSQELDEREQGQKHPLKAQLRWCLGQTDTHVFFSRDDVTLKEPHLSSEESPRGLTLPSRTSTSERPGRSRRVYQPRCAPCGGGLGTAAGRPGGADHKGAKSGRIVLETWGQRRNSMEGGLRATPAHVTSRQGGREQRGRGSQRTEGRGRPRRGRGAW